MPRWRWQPVGSGDRLRLRCQQPIETAKTDRNGRVTEYDYDNLGRRIAEDWISGGSSIYTATYAYDAAGHLTSASDGGSDYAFTYNSNGLPVCLKPFDRDRFYVAAIVRPDSFGAFKVFRDQAIALRYEYRLMPVEANTPIIDSGGGDGRVQ